MFEPVPEEDHRSFQPYYVHNHVQDPMHMDQARMKRGLWMGQQVGRKKSSHAKSSKVDLTPLQDLPPVTGRLVQSLSDRLKRKTGMTPDH